MYDYRPSPQTVKHLKNLGNFVYVIISKYNLKSGIFVSKVHHKGSKITISLTSEITWVRRIIFFVLRNTGVLPSNYFTNYTMPIGSALETIFWGAKNAYFGHFSIL